MENILDSLIKSFGTNNKLQQMMQLCTIITEEEAPNINHPKKLPYGPNVFLSIEIPPRKKKKINYLTLERENEDTWVVILYEMLEKNYENEDEHPKLIKAHEVKDHRPNKILTEFAKKVKFYRGEKNESKRETNL